MSQIIRDNLKRMLAPRHVAFVGGRSMARALKRCAEGGYPGQMWLVNPQHESLEGVPCVRSVADLPCGPDAVFIATNRDLTLTCVAELAAKLAARDVSSTEITRHLLARAQAHDSLGAYLTHAPRPGCHGAAAASNVAEPPPSMAL